MQLFYRKMGEGFPLIIIHGLYGSSDNWLTIGKALSKYFTVYLIDQRNHGASPHSDTFNYPAMVDDLREFIETHQLKNVSLLGHSIGGKTAMLYSLTYPGEISNLIVADISPRSYAGKGGNTPQYELHKNIINAMINIDVSQMESRREVQKELMKSIQNQNVTQFLLKNLYRDDNNNFSCKINLKALKNNLNYILEGITPEHYHTDNKIPALFIKGENSDYIKDEDEPLIKELFPYSQLVTISDTGHWLHAEKPEDFIKTIKNFIF